MKKSLFFSVLMLGALVFAGCQKEETDITDTTKLWLAQEDKGTDWGYINEKGKFIISAKFLSATSFSNGYAKVKEGVNDDYAFIDKNGKVVMAEANDYADFFYNGVCIYRDGKDLGFIDKNFKVVCVPQFASLYQMSADGLALCWEQGESLGAYCDKNGKIVIPAQFQYASSFAGGVAVVAEEDKEGNVRYGLINTKGNFVVDYNKTPMSNLGEGVIAFLNSSDKVGLLNSKGKEILQATYDDIDGFSEGLAAAYKGEKTGYINTKGDVVIELQKYDYAGYFRDGVAWVKKANSEKYDLINKKGDVILTLTSAQVPQTNFHNGLALVINTDTYKKQYIDKKGNKIYSWEPGGFSYVPAEEALKADFRSTDAAALQMSNEAMKAAIRK
jgi:hypothetical protein